MGQINSKSTADLFFQLNWTHEGVNHTDAYAGHQINIWRDMMPSPLYEKLIGRQSGDMASLSLYLDELIGSTSEVGIQTINRKQFSGSRISVNNLRPRLGRFYPKGVLADITGIFSANRTPFRCIGINNGKLQLDMGHPLAGRTFDLLVTVGAIRSPIAEHGGNVRNWGEIISDGVGMQARWKNQPTDFFSDRPFRRMDQSPDALFYSMPRLVQHLDDTALDMVLQIYARFLNDKTRVLDLMGSWKTHLPDHIRPKQMTGLGLNEIELEHNGRLNARIVHDLNADVNLPFEENEFDVVVCTVSIEYLISPLEIFEEVARVLKPGGYFVVSFSNRWFEPKVIRIWTELLEFERMGLVLEYFKRSGKFEDLNTYSIRGLTRPANDKYYGKIVQSDPVYAVWGKKLTN